MDNKKYHLVNIMDKYVVFFPDTIKIFEVDLNTFNLLNESNISSLELTEFINTNSISKELLMNEIENIDLQSIAFNVAQNCNMKCVYCFGEEGTYGKSGMMKVETAKTAIEKLLNNNLKNKTISFFGGEPLLNFEMIKELVNYLKNNFNEIPKYSITTNGTLITEEIADFFKKNNFYIIISIDGDEKIHNELRPLKNSNTSFSYVRRGIELLKKYNCEFEYRCTLSDLNYNINFFSNIIPKVKFAPLVSSDKEELVVNLENYKKHLDQIFKPNFGKKDFYTEYINILNKKIKKNLNCATGIKFVTVSTDGDIYYCHRYTNNDTFKLGNINDYNDKILKNNIKRIYNEVHNSLIIEDDCKQCWAKYLCGGGCMHERLESKKYKNNKNIYCNIRKMFYEYIFIHYAYTKGEERC